MQASVRERLNNFLTEKGTTQMFICNRINLPKSVLSGFKNGKRDLYPETLTKLDCFLQNEGLLMVK